MPVKAVSVHGSFTSRHKNLAFSIFTIWGRVRTQALVTASGEQTSYDATFLNYPHIFTAHEGKGKER